MKAPGIRIAVVGCFLQVGLVIAKVGEVIGMRRTFAALESTDADKTGELASGIGFALNTAAIGLSLSLVGLVLIAIALIRSRLRARWFYWSLWSTSVIWLACFRFGFVVAVPLMLYLLLCMKTFLKDGGEANQPPDPTRLARPESGRTSSI